MSEVLVKNKDIVVPGEVLARGMDYLPGNGTYREGDNIHAGLMGLVNIDGRALKLIPLSGRYLPKRGDVVIGKVIDIMLSSWRIDIGSAYSAVLGVKDGTSDFVMKGADLTRYFNIDEFLVSKITNVTSQMLVDLTMRGPGLRKLFGGRIVEVGTHKVPRIIGKQGSMVSMIKLATECKIIVGQNGLVWIQGEPDAEFLAVETIRKIEAESHTAGLTDRIKTFLEEKTGKPIPENIPVERPPQEEYHERRDDQRDRRPYNRDNNRGNFRPRGDRPPRREFVPRDAPAQAPAPAAPAPAPVEPAPQGGEAQ